MNKYIFYDILYDMHMKQSMTSNRSNIPYIFQHIL